MTNEVNEMRYSLPCDTTSSTHAILLSSQEEKKPKTFEKYFIQLSSSLVVDPEGFYILHNETSHFKQPTFFN